MRDIVISVQWTRAETIVLFCVLNGRNKKCGNGFPIFKSNRSRTN